MIALLCILCILLGAVSGAFIEHYRGRRRDAAPVPIDLGYDPTNPINGGLNGHHGEPVEVCGVTMWRQ